jgi:hypothetical protein
MKKIFLQEKTISVLFWVSKLLGVTATLLYNKQIVAQPNGTRVSLSLGGECGSHTRALQIVA